MVILIFHFGGLVPDLSVVIPLQFSAGKFNMLTLYGQKTKSCSMSMRWLFPVGLIFSMLLASAQELQNTRASYANGQVLISYDLASVNPEQKYNIQLFASHNGFASPLSLVTGDIGKGISTGTSKEIKWDAAKELGTFRGQLSFKVVAEMVPLPFAFRNPAVGAALRQGKKSIVEWRGGVPGHEVRLEVYQGSTRVSSLGEVTNTGTYTWTVPKDLEKGEGYTLKISEGEVSARSELFIVKPKVPLLLKLSPLLLGAAILPFVGGSEPPEPITEDHTPLSPAPQPN